MQRQISVRPIRLDLYRTAIPMRRFQHAAVSRDVSEAVLVRVEFADGSMSWGETLPREYVTGETIDSVLSDIADIVWPGVAGLEISPDQMPGAVPDARAAGRCTNSAVCAVELAIIGRMLADNAELLERISGQARRRRIAARVSGVLGSDDPDKTARRLRAMQWFGLADFKLKLGFGQDIDAANLRVVTDRIGKAVARGRCTLRVDINGGWDMDTTPQRVSELNSFGVCVVEQPVYCSAGELADLARRCGLPLMADESLLTADDARELSGADIRPWWNVRISKNGGLGRALSLTRLAAERDVTVVLGCMVGESSILSAAQRSLLQYADGVAFVEGNYGRFLLSDDLTTKSLRFGYGGRLRALRGRGIGVEVDPHKLAQFASLAGTLGA